MKTLLKIFFMHSLILVPSEIFPQNLIPNGGFEQYVLCPDNHSQLQRLVNWFNPSLATPDYFNSCDTIPFTAGVPENYSGYQSAYNGNGYAGIIIMYGPIPNTREYIEAPFSIPLEAGSCYQFSMHVCLAESSVYKTDAIQVYFSDTIVGVVNNTGVITVPAQISNMSGVIDDTAQWKTISGIYQAHGGEQFLTIGNFKDDSNTSYQMTNFGTFYTSFVYIDDVSLIEINCNNDIGETSFIQPLIFPNPFNNVIHIENKNNFELTFELYNFISQKVLDIDIQQSCLIDAISIIDGFYSYRIKKGNKVFSNGILIKN